MKNLDLSYISSERFGKLAVAATNISLAAELYLKTLRILSGRSVPEDHHLWTLYKNLPLELKSRIQKDFDNGFTRDINNMKSYMLSLSRGPIDQDELKRQQELMKPNNFKKMLVSASDTFITWRYLYESGDDTEANYYHFQYNGLLLLCEIVRSICMEGINHIERRRESEELKTTPQA